MKENQDGSKSYNSVEELRADVSMDRKKQAMISLIDSSTAIAYAEGRRDAMKVAYEWCKDDNHHDLAEAVEMEQKRYQRIRRDVFKAAGVEDLGDEDESTTY